ARAQKRHAAPPGPEWSADGGRMTVAGSERTAGLKQELWAEIDRRRDQLARLCADGLRVPAENPPGDTRAIADHYARVLEKAGLRAERVEPRPTPVSLVATLAGREAQPRFAFNGRTAP